MRGVQPGEVAPEPVRLDVQLAPADSRGGVGMASAEEREDFLQLPEAEATGAVGCCGCLGGRRYGKVQQQERQGEGHRVIRGRGARRVTHWILAGCRTL